MISIDVPAQIKQLILVGEEGKFRACVFIRGVFNVSNMYSS